MYCDAPTIAYRRPGTNPATGNHWQPWCYHRFVDDSSFKKLYADCPSDSEVVILPCQRCLLCTRRYRLHWVLRCMHEARYYDEMCYLTLTVDDEHIDQVFPPVGRSYNDGMRYNSLDHKPYQDFLKRLRRQLSYGYHLDKIVDGKPVHQIYRGEPGKPLRFFMCGEYGDLYHRPHYHAIIFGFYPPDAVPLRGHLCTSQLIADKWPFGYHTVAHVVESSISYVAGYVDKKMDDARMSWAVNGIKPEYVNMSRGCAKLGTGGIGRSFFDDYFRDIYPLNEDGTLARNYAIIGRGTRVSVPRFYDDLLSLRSRPLYDTIRLFRDEVGAHRRQEIDLDDWLDESHRRCAVAVARRLQRDPGADVSVDACRTHVA